MHVIERRRVAWHRASPMLTHRSAALGRSPASACDGGRRRPCAGSYSAIVAQTDERVCATTSAAPLHPLRLRQPLDAQVDGRGIEAATPGAAAAAGGLARTPPGQPLR